MRIFSYQSDMTAALAINRKAEFLQYFDALFA